MDGKKIGNRGLLPGGESAFELPQESAENTEPIFEPRSQFKLRVIM